MSEDEYPKRFEDGRLKGRLYLEGSPFAIIEYVKGGWRCEIRLVGGEDILSLASLASEMALAVNQEREGGE